MSDAVSRDAVLDILDEDGWLWWTVERIRAIPAVQPDTREAALREALEAVNAKWRSGAASTLDEVRGLALAEAAILDLIEGQQP